MEDLADQLNGLILRDEAVRLDQFTLFPKLPFELRTKICKQQYMTPTTTSLLMTDTAVKHAMVRHSNKKFLLHVDIKLSKSRTQWLFTLHETIDGDQKSNINKVQAAYISNITLSHVNHEARNIYRQLPSQYQKVPCTAGKKKDNRNWLPSVMLYDPANTLLFIDNAHMLIQENGRKRDCKPWTQILGNCEWAKFVEHVVIKQQSKKLADGRFIHGFRMLGKFKRLKSLTWMSRDNQELNDVDKLAGYLKDLEASKKLWKAHGHGGKELEIVFGDMRGDIVTEREVEEVRLWMKSAMESGSGFELDIAGNLAESMYYI